MANPAHLIRGSGGFSRYEGGAVSQHHAEALEHLKALVKGAEMLVAHEVDGVVSLEAFQHPADKFAANSLVPMVLEDFEERNEGHHSAVGEGIDKADDPGLLLVPGQNDVGASVQDL